MTTPQLRFTGNLFFNLTDRAVPTPNPVEFALSVYSKGACLGYNEATAATDLAVADGSITAPKCVFIEVEEGDCTFRWETGSSVGTRLSMDADPVPTQRAMLLMFTPVGASRTLYITSTGAFKCRVWLFQ